jgi:hypothetical protein
MGIKDDTDKMNRQSVDYIPGDNRATIKQNLKTRIKKGNMRQQSHWLGNMRAKTLEKECVCM